MLENFRRARATDFGAVCRLFDDAVAALHRQGIDQWDDVYPSRRLLRSDIRKRHMYLLTMDGEIVSAVVINKALHPLYDMATWSPGRFRIVHRLCVDPAKQARGIGEKTMRHVEQLLAGKGVHCIRLDAFMENPMAMRLYGSLGYVQTGAVIFRKGDFMLFEKVLTDNQKRRQR